MYCRADAQRCFGWRAFASLQASDSASDATDGDCTVGGDTVAPTAATAAAAAADDDTADTADTADVADAAVAAADLADCATDDDGEPTDGDTMTRVPSLVWLS